MALDPRISLAARAPDVEAAFSNALLNVQRLEGIRQGREEQPLRNRLLEAQVGQTEAGTQETQQLNRIRSIAVGAAELLPAIQSGNVDAVRSQLQQRRSQLLNQQLPTNDTDEALALIDQPGGLEQLGQISQQAIQMGRQFGVVESPAGQISSAEQRAFEANIADLSPEEQDIARRVKLGLSPRAVGSGKITTAVTPGLAEQVAESEGQIAGAKEGEKLKKQLKFLPKIRAAVKAAEVRAAAEGEALTDLARSQAAMPGLREAVSQLRELAPVATSTLGGRFFDVAVKETGFGSTEGANARVKFIAIINNQVLPLLRQTFGAAFTEREGETLKATMGDPNATPEQKVLQLESFIDQKARNIQSSQREVGVDITPTEELTTGQAQRLVFDPQSGQLVPK